MPVALFNFLHPKAKNAHIYKHYFLHIITQELNLYSNEAVQWVLIVDKEDLLNEATLPDWAKENVVFIKKQINNSLHWYWFKKRTLPSLVKRYRVTYLIDVFGNNRLTTTTTNQLIINFESVFQPQHWFFKQRESKQPTLNTLINKAIFINLFAKNEQNVTVNKGVNSSLKKTYFQPILPKNCLPISHWDERQEVKNKIADGKEYVAAFCSNNESEWFTLLKAFSKLKNWQSSQIKLIIYVHGDIMPLHQKLASYKFKDSVIVFSGQQPYNSIIKTIAAAYTVVITGFNANSSLLAAHCMACETPFMIDARNKIFDWLKDANTFTENDFEQLANLLKLYYKDEKLCKFLKEKGQALATNFNNNWLGFEQ
ncbi:MAG: hypothetical protein ACOVQE_06090 [Chitinophagaceae bacterium]